MLLRQDLLGEDGIGPEATQAHPFLSAARQMGSPSTSRLQVARQWLGHCLARFLWTKQAKHLKQDGKEMLSGQLTEGSYVHTRCACRHAPVSLGLVEDKGRCQWWSNRELNIKNLCSRWCGLRHVVLVRRHRCRKADDHCDHAADCRSEDTSQSCAADGINKRRETDDA